MSDQSDSGLSLKKDMASSLIDPAFHDLIIVSSDGVEIAASRTILALRSSFFKAMLRCDMQEATSGKVTFRNINSVALHAVLQFIYSEDIDWIDFTEAIDVCHAADFLLLPKLMIVASERTRDIKDFGFSVSLLNDTVISLPWSESIKKLYDVLFKPLCTRLLAIGDLNELSENALELFLMKSTEAEFNTPEYTLLLCIVEWAWAQNPTAPPAAERRAFFDAIHLMPVDASLKIQPTNGPSRVPLLKMIQHVNFTLICPHRLKSLMDAVEILTETLPQNLAFCYYACKNTFCFQRHPSRFRGIPCKRDQFQWDKSKSGMNIVLSEDDTVAECSANICNSVRTSTPCKADPDGLCEWNIVIESANFKNHYIMGFVSESFESFNCSISDQWGIGEVDAWQYPSNMRVFLSGVITFHLNMNNHTCKVSINGRDSGVFWNNLPHNNLYPAVSLWCGGKCRIGSSF